jgi:hypothetical protein
MPTKKATYHQNDGTKTKAIALGKAIRELREERKLSRAELLERFYKELENAGIDYKVKGDWWLTGIESGDKAKQLPREYINAFIRALKCTNLEAVRLLMLADLNMLEITSDTAYTAGLAYVLTEIFTTALKTLEAKIDEETAAQLDEREWMEVGKAVIEVVTDDLANRLARQTTD